VPQLRVTSFLLEKRDSKPSECEDALAVDLRRRRFAVADGATEAFNSRRWAKRLVSAWVRRTSDDIDILSFRDDVAVLGRQSGARFARRQLPWYLQEKALQGSFAAFLGLQMDEAGTWDVIALGDCCLIQETDGGVSSFPLTSPEDFHNRPMLVPSLMETHGDCVQYARQDRGISLPGDVLLLMSDAIACWYLAVAHERPALKTALHRALAEGQRTDVAALLAEERTAKQLRNDDVAIIRIEVMSV
jgi:hypothetical protein